MIEKFKNVLVLAPHTDDGELGAGGTISRLMELGANIHYIAFSVCEQSVPHGFSELQLETELFEATKELGFKRENVRALRFRVREFPSKRQDVLQYMIDELRPLNPDLVLIPSPEDLHQDHQVIANEAMRTFKTINILSYELPWNNLNFTNHYFVKLKKHHVEKKSSALSKYKTQAHRPYFQKDFVASQARMRGIQISAEYAEVFQIIRMVS